MRHQTFLLSLCALFTWPATAAGQWPDSLHTPATKAELLLLTARYLENPLAQMRLPGYLSEESQRNPLVHVIFPPDVRHLGCGQDSAALQVGMADYAVAGYAAGEIQAQLKAGRAVDMPEAGAAGAITAYDFVRGELTSSPTLPVLERWRLLAAKGLLRGHLDSLVAGQLSDCSE